MFGSYGWFGRYHIYFAAWILVLFFAAYARTPMLRLSSLGVL